VRYIFHKQQKTFKQNHQTEARSLHHFRQKSARSTKRQLNNNTWGEAVTMPSHVSTPSRTVGWAKRLWGKIDGVKFKKDHIDNIFKTNCPTQQQTVQKKQHYVQTICRLWASKSAILGEEILREKTL